MVPSKPSEWGWLAAGDMSLLSPLARASQLLAARVELLLVETEVKRLQSGT